MRRALQRREPESFTQSHWPKRESPIRDNITLLNLNHNQTIDSSASRTECPPRNGRTRLIPAPTERKPRSDEARAPYVLFRRGLRGTEGRAHSGRFGIRGIGLRDLPDPSTVALGLHLQAERADTSRPDIASTFRPLHRRIGHEHHLQRNEGDGNASVWWSDHARGAPGPIATRARYVLGGAARPWPSGPPRRRRGDRRLRLRDSRHTCRDDRGSHPR